MSCRYSDYEGYCQLYEDSKEIDCMGFDYDTGMCLVQDDPYPSESCEDYDEC